MFTVAAEANSYINSTCLKSTLNTETQRAQQSPLKHHMTPNVYCTMTHAIHTTRKYKKYINIMSHAAQSEISKLQCSPILKPTRESRHQGNYGGIPA